MKFPPPGPSPPCCVASRRPRRRLRPPSQSPRLPPALQSGRVSNNRETDRRREMERQEWKVRRPQPGHIGKQFRANQDSPERMHPTTATLARKWPHLELLPDLTKVRARHQVAAFAGVLGFLVFEQ